MKTYQKISALAIFILLINLVYAKAYSTTPVDGEAVAVADATVTVFNKHIVLADSQTVEIKKIAIEYYESRLEAKKIKDEKEQMKALAEIYSKFVSSYEGVLTEEQLQTLKAKQKEEAKIIINSDK